LKDIRERFRAQPSDVSGKNAANGYGTFFSADG
jgi:hypothetical protein